MFTLKVRTIIGSFSKGETIVALDFRERMAI
jgi:hypothetical protein